MIGKVIVREAEQKDRRALWEWRNDPVTGRIFNTERSVNYRDHCRWFDELLVDSNRILCIGLVETMRIGSVRFKTLEEGAYEAALYLKPPYTGKGYGSLILKEAVLLLSKVRKVGTVTARINPVNAISRQLFENAGFQCRPDLSNGLICSMDL